MKIKFIPQNIEVDLNPNKSVLNIALENGIQIHSICKGVPSCAECRIKVAEGDSFVSKPSKAELNLIGNSYYLDGRRLSCQVRCFGPVTIDTTEQVNRQDNPSKKIRGFKSEKQYESKAVLDTMLLTEQPADTSASESLQAPEQRSRDQQDRGDHQKEGHNQNQRHGQRQDQKQNRDQGQNRHQQKNQGRGQDNRQARGPNQNQNPNQQKQNRPQQNQQRHQGQSRPQGGQQNQPKVPNQPREQGQDQQGNPNKDSRRDSKS